MTTRHAFVTGGTGFLGVNLIKQLNAAGWQVTAMHRPTSDLTYLSRFSAELVVADITDRASILGAMPTDVDAVFHVAGNVSFEASGDAAQTRDNVEGTANMVAASLAKGAGRFIHTSSGASYGLHDGIPINEETPSNAMDVPVNYFRTKKRAEDAALAGIKEGLDVVVVNPTNIVGPFDRVIWGPMITAIADGALNSVGTGGGSFCHVDETAKAHIAAFEKGVTGGRYLLAGAVARFEEVGRVIAQLTGGTAPVASDTRDPTISPELHYMLSKMQIVESDRAEKELGYKAVSLERMFGDLCAWMRAEGLLGAA